MELTREGKATIAILAFAVVLWMTEAIPFAATALVMLLLIPVFGVSSYADTVQLGFGHPIVTDAPDTPARVAIQKLARRLAGEVVDKAPPSGFINRLLGRNEKKPVKAS